MGKIAQGILGGVSGKVGSVIGTSWKGINALRSMPLSVANPRTVGQVNQRNKLRYMVVLAQAWLGILIKPLWDRFAQKQSGYNAFVSANISNVGTSGTSLIDYSLLTLSRGKLGITEPTASSVSPGDPSIDVTWDPSPVGQQQATDIAFIGVIVQTNDGDLFSSASGVDRDSGASGCPLPPTQSGNIVHVYLSFRSTDGRNVSNTGYVSVSVS